MKKYIVSRADIDRLMNHFYSKATKDDVIGYIFTDIAKLDLEHHLPIIGDFWETLLFRTGNY
jgi:hemoglobin